MSDTNKLQITDEQKQKAHARAKQVYQTYRANLQEVCNIYQEYLANDPNDTVVTGTITITLKGLAVYQWVDAVLEFPGLGTISFSGSGLSPTLGPILASGSGTVSLYVPLSQIPSNGLVSVQGAVSPDGGGALIQFYGNGNLLAHSELPLSGIGVITVSVSGSYTVTSS